MAVKKEKKATTKAAPARKVLETRDEKTGELTGSQSLDGRDNIPTAAPTSTSKKALTVEPDNSNSIEHAHQILESHSYHRQAILKPKFFLDYEQPGQFGGLPLFGYSEGHPVDQFANLLKRLDGIVLEDLARAVVPKIAGQETIYQVSLNDILVLASEHNFSRKLDDDRQSGTVEYYNQHGLNDLPRPPHDQLTLDDLTELNKWILNWSFNFENILPMPMSAKEKNVYLVAIEYASHVDLALRMRQELSPTVYGAVTDLWRKQVGAISPEDNDIYVGDLPIFLRF